MYDSLNESEKVKVFWKTFQQFGITIERNYRVFIQSNVEDFNKNLKFSKDRNLLLRHSKLDHLTLSALLSDPVSY